mmetsp:Transcript_69877/g.112725  ORF Transcript_69877/g.112725 Transcript_69877/m.112725 type:complete len:257 (+) Transcript_69877:789-1559(+)
MTGVCPQALSLVVVIPNANLAIHPSREQQVRCVWEPADLLHAHGVTRPRVDPLLGQEALLVVDILVDAGLVLHPRPAGVVSLLATVEDRRDTLFGLPFLSFHCSLLFSLPCHLLLSCLDLNLDLLPDGFPVNEATPLRRIWVGLLGCFRHVRARYSLPLVLRLVVDAGAVLSFLDFGAHQNFLARGKVSCWICSIAVVVESEILLFESEVADACLLYTAHLVVVEGLLNTHLPMWDGTLDWLIQNCNGRIDHDFLV